MGIGGRESLAYTATQISQEGRALSEISQSQKRQCITLFPSNNRSMES